MKKHQSGVHHAKKAHHHAKQAMMHAEKAERHHKMHMDAASQAGPHIANMGPVNMRSDMKAQQPSEYTSPQSYNKSQPGINMDGELFKRSGMDQHAAVQKFVGHNAIHR